MDLVLDGEGFVDFQTRVSGKGRVVLNTEGPVEEIELKGERLAVEGKQVIGATRGWTTARRPSRSLIAYWLSGEEMGPGLQRLRPGNLTLAALWSQRLLAALERSSSTERAFGAEGREGGGRTAWPRR